MQATMAFYEGAGHQVWLLMLELLVRYWLSRLPSPCHGLSGELRHIIFCPEKGDRASHLLPKMMSASRQ